MASPVGRVAAPESGRRADGGGEDLGEVRKPRALRERLFSRSATSRTCPGGDAEQALSLGKVLADQAVGVLVEAVLPGVVGAGEIHIGGKGRVDLAVAGDLLTVVQGDGQHGVLDRPDLAVPDGNCSVEPWPECDRHRIDRS